MIYSNTSTIIKRILEVPEFKIQAIVFSLGIFTSLFSVALFGGMYWLIIAATTTILLGALVLISKRSLVNISENGPMKEVEGISAVRWGLYYIFFGILILSFYFFI